MKVMTQNPRAEAAASIGGITAEKPAIPGKTSVILVPMNFSPGDIEVAGFAIQVARHIRSRMILVCAVQLNLSPYAPIPLSRLKAELCKEAFDKCEELMQRAARSGIAVTCVVEEGQPAEVILRAAARFNPELVVMSGLKSGLLSRIFGGGMTERVLRNMKCPVLTLETQNKTEAYD